MNNVGDILLSYVQLGYITMMDKGGDLLIGFKALYGTMLLCSVIIYGTLIIAGQIAGNGKELVKTCIWAVAASSLLNSNIYNSLIIEPIHYTKDNLAIFMAPGTGSTVFESIQASFAGLMGYGQALIDSGSIMTNLMPIVVGGTVMLVSGIYYIAIVANLLFCELSLYLLYFLGMFIIPLAAFQSARPMLKSWAKAIAKYCLVFVVTGSLVGLLDATMRPLLQEVLTQSYQNGGYSDKGVSSIYLACVITLSCFGAYLMTKVMEFSAELTGGVMSEGAAGTKSISDGFKNTMNAASTFGRYGGSSLSTLKAARKTQTP